MKRIKRGKSHFTQWTGQFSVAAQLSRLGYTVGLTLGNTPDTDLLCQHIDGGSPFGLQVKSLSSKTFFPVANLTQGDGDDLFAFVYIPKRASEPLEFYIATREELRKTIEEYIPSRTRVPKGVQHAPFSTGVAYRAFKMQEGRFKDRWDKLPIAVTETTKTENAEQKR